MTASRLLSKSNLVHGSDYGFSIIGQRCITNITISKEVGYRRRRGSPKVCFCDGLNYQDYRLQSSSAIRNISHLAHVHVINSALAPQVCQTQIIQSCDMSPALLCFLAVRLFSNHGQHGESLPFLRAPSAAASLTRGSLSAAFSARSSAIPPKRLSPEWARLSDDLTALVLREGPVQLGKVSGAYHAMHGKPLKLYGSTLTQIIKSGNLQGIRYDTSKLVIRLDETTTAGKTSARKPGLPELSKRLRSLVAVKGSLPLSSIAAKYKSVYGRELKSHLPTRGLKKNLVKGNLKGIRYNAKRDKVEVNDTQVMPAKGSRSPTTPQLAKKRKLISAAAVNQSGDEKLVGTDSLDQGEGERRRSTPKNGNTSIRQPDNDDKVLPLSSTRDPPLPHLLIDSPDSCTKSLVALSCGGALRSTLQQICVRGMVVMQLNGHQLGSEAGKISFVKVCPGSGRLCAGISLVMKYFDFLCGL